MVHRTSVGGAHGEERLTRRSRRTAQGQRRHRSLDHDRGRVRVHKESDHFGQFELTGVEPGDVELIVYKPGYEGRTLMIDAFAGKPVEIRDWDRSPLDLKF
jgi:hypothetical protein